jgi:hypothetical protein
MGHERVGALPKTRRWRNLVEQIAGFSAGQCSAGDIAKTTIENVRSRLRGISDDPGVHASFKFLVALAVASRAPDPPEWVRPSGIALPASPTPLGLVKALNRWAEPQRGSREYGDISQSAAADAVATWHRRHAAQQPLLEPQPFDVWRGAADGAGFCELARLFFAGFTERYLNYFLEREASAVLPSVAERDRFEQQLAQHLDRVSRHAFDTARITQSFAAGWFNRHAAQGLPGDEEIRQFLNHSFGKIRDELQRGGEGG